MKPLLPLLPLGLILAGCAAQGEPATTRDQEAFASEIADRTAGEAQSCIPTRQSEGLTIVDRRTIVRREGRTIWVNRLQGDCPGLRPLNTLIVEAHGSQYCRGDLVRGLDPGTTVPGAACPLQDWVPYRANAG